MGDVKDQMVAKTKTAGGLFDKVSNFRKKSAPEPAEIADTFKDKVGEVDTLLDKMIAIKEKDLQTEGKTKEDENKKKLNYLMMMRENLNTIIRAAEGYSNW